jgi:hypothetical protein
MISTLVHSIGDDILPLSRSRFHPAELNKVSNANSALRDRMKENAVFIS